MRVEELELATGFAAALRDAAVMRVGLGAMGFRARAVCGAEYSKLERDCVAVERCAGEKCSCDQKLRAKTSLQFH